MAYINQDDKKRIAARLKPVLARYGVKGTLSIRNHSTITLTVKSGKIDFIGNYTRGAKPEIRADAEKFGIDVNTYWYQDHFTGKAKDFITDALVALKSADWYDESDAMTDYFNTAYYVSIHIGKWNKPYTVEA